MILIICNLVALFFALMVRAYCTYIHVCMYVCVLYVHGMYVCIRKGSVLFMASRGCTPKCGHLKS